MVKYSCENYYLKQRPVITMNNYAEIFLNGKSILLFRKQNTIKIYPNSINSSRLNLNKEIYKFPNLYINYNKPCIQEKVKKMNKTLLSYTNSQTAKNGYKEEALVCLDLNNNYKCREKFLPILGNNYTECTRILGTHKCDIQSSDSTLKGQVKKYKKGRFQQLDRHWTSKFIENIPELHKYSQILTDLFEYPLLPNGTHIDKSKNIKKLCNSNYSQEILNNLINTFNKNKKEILEYAFYGYNVEMRPEYLFGVNYENGKRDKIVLFKIEDAINYLEKLDFKISPKKTCINLGIKRSFSLQRKGGDNGKKSSNQLQIKIILSEIIDKIPVLEYKL